MRRIGGAFAIELLDDRRGVRDRIALALEPPSLTHHAVEVDVARPPEPRRRSLTGWRTRAMPDGLRRTRTRGRGREGDGRRRVRHRGSLAGARWRSMKASTSSSVNRTWLPIRTQRSLPAFTSRSIVSVEIREVVRQRPRDQRAADTRAPRPGAQQWGARSHPPAAMTSRGLELVESQSWRSFGRSLVALTSGVGITHSVKPVEVRRAQRTSQPRCQPPRIKSSLPRDAADAQASAHPARAALSLRAVRAPRSGRVTEFGTATAIELVPVMLDSTSA